MIISILIIKFASREIHRTSGTKSREEMQGQIQDREFESEAGDRFHS
jgi:hypothetical protein